MQESGPARPCRTLFIRNVDYSTSAAEIEALFAPFGEIKTVFDLISTRGLIFLTFYDLRSSQLALSALSKSVFKNRNIDVHFSTPKASDYTKQCTRDNNQGTLQISTIKNGKLISATLRAHLGIHGAIKDLRIPGDSTRAYVEYFDSRDVARCYDFIEKTPEFERDRLECKYIWDDKMAKSLAIVSSYRFFGMKPISDTMRAY